MARAGMSIRVEVRAEDAEALMVLRDIVEGRRVTPGRRALLIGWCMERAQERVLVFDAEPRAVDLSDEVG